MDNFNHQMQNYDFIEGGDFVGLMPNVIEKTQGIGVNDNSKSTVFFGFEAKGVDPMEVVDNEFFFEESDGSNTGEGGNETPTTGDTVNP